MLYILEMILICDIYMYTLHSLLEYYLHTALVVLFAPVSLCRHLSLMYNYLRIFLRKVPDIARKWPTHEPRTQNLRHLE